METGSTHSPFYAQNMMYMRTYDPSGFQRASYEMGKVYFLIYCFNWASLIDFFVLFLPCYEQKVQWTFNLVKVVNVSIAAR
jgi:hypothetical protein